MPYPDMQPWLPAGRRFLFLIDKMQPRQFAIANREVNCFLSKKTIEALGASPQTAGCRFEARLRASTPRGLRSTAPGAIGTAVADLGLR
jgi:hypothetical protein